MHSLDPLPDTIRPLSDPESDRLRRLGLTDWANPRTSCLTCGGKQVFLSPQGETECDCVAQWVLHRFLLNAGVGTSYQRYTWDDIDPQVPEAVQMALLEYCDASEAYVRAGVGMILHGPSGTGKTLLSTLLLKKLLAAGYDGYFTQFNDLLDAYTAGWRSPEDREWFVTRMRNTTVLVIDDVGKEYKGKAELTGSIFDMVIRHRVAYSRPTIITTNYSMEEMRSNYGGAAMSLLAESSEQVHVPGVDYRARARDRGLADVRAGIVRPVVLA